MAKITSLIEKLQSDSQSYAHLVGLRVIDEGLFAWNAPAMLLSYDGNHTEAEALLLHEYAHAVLNHQQYTTDVELLTMERDAWELAHKLAESYSVSITEDIVQDSLDTYRDWLHSRSICPHCGSTGIQTAQAAYLCLACHHNWRVNEARTCALRRYDTKKRP